MMIISILTCSTLTRALARMLLSTKLSWLKLMSRDLSLLEHKPWKRLTACKETRVVFGMECLLRVRSKLMYSDYTDQIYLLKTLVKLI